jgi:hypothetical protein
VCGSGERVGERVRERREGNRKGGQGRRVIGREEGGRRVTGKKV